MADAGKVAILPRGLWSAETVYEPLDLVYYDNNSFVALKESVGVTPVDGDTWMLSLSGISQETINAILNGTQQVGDSAKLGGEDASEYALNAEVKKVTGTEIVKSILQQALDVSEGVYNYTSIGGANYPSLNELPHELYAYSSATIIKRTPTNIVVILWGIKQGVYTYPTATNIYDSTGWSGWRIDATTADLANKLDKTGGGALKYLDFNYDGYESKDYTVRVYEKEKGVFAFRNGDSAGNIAQLDTNNLGGVKDILHTGNRIELVGTVSGINNPITFDTNVYKELYCELSYFGSAKVTFDIIVPNGGTYNSGLKLSTGVTGGSVYITGNTIQTSSFYFEDIARTDENIALTVYGKR